MASVEVREAGNYKLRFVAYTPKEILRDYGRRHSRVIGVDIAMPTGETISLTLCDGVISEAVIYMDDFSDGIDLARKGLEDALGAQVPFPFNDEAPDA